MKFGRCILLAVFVLGAVSACSPDIAEMDAHSAPERRADFDDCVRAALDQMVGEWTFERLMALPNGKVASVETSSDIKKEREGVWHIRGFGGANASESTAVIEYWGEGRYTKRAPDEDAKTAFSVMYTACDQPDNQNRYRLQGQYDYTIHSIGKTMSVNLTEYISRNGTYVIESYVAKDGSGDTAYRTSLYGPR